MLGSRCCLTRQSVGLLETRCTKRWNKGGFGVSGLIHHSMKKKGYSDMSRLSEAQQLLEAWWNEDAEMRRVEILCGQHYRVCVRLFQLQGDGQVQVGAAEAGRLEMAIRAAVAQARNKVAGV